MTCCSCQLAWAYVASMNERDESKVALVASTDQRHRHKVPDTSGRRCALCKKCLHRGIVVDGSRATCRTLGKMFYGW